MSANVPARIRACMCLYLFSIVRITPAVITNNRKAPITAPMISGFEELVMLLSPGGSVEVVMKPSS